MPGGRGEQRFTVIPLPVMPAAEATMQSRADAVEATYTGRLQGAVDLYRLTVERNGWMVGILSTMAHGLLGLPLAWQGDPEMASALADQDSTPGDFARMHPENECAKIFSDGLGLGFGLGQYVLACWRCDGVEWLRAQGASAAHTEVETCKTCSAVRSARPIGVRELYQLRWRDARWLWRDPTTLQWRYDGGRQGTVNVNPGDGEWFLFRTVPDQDIWVHGPWALGTEAAIFARDSRYDRQNTSASCAPTHVFKATGGSAPATRRDIEAQADGLRFGNSITLPGEWEHRIDSATGTYIEVTEKVVCDSADLWEVCLTGNRMGTQSGTGFANMDIYARATRERRRFYAGAWIRQIRTQGLIWYTLENFGSRACPVGVYDTRSPEDKLAESKALAADGSALDKLRTGYDALGYELAPEWIQEHAQAKGIRIIAKRAPESLRDLGLGVDATAALVRGVEGRASKGLPPFGDERDGQTIALLMGDYVATPPPGAKPATAMPNAPPGGSTPALGRVEDDCDPEDCEDGDCDAEDCARLAAQMTEHGLDACPHKKKNRCRLCGVQAVRAVIPGIDGAAPTYATTWRASVAPKLVRKGPEAAPVAATKARRRRARTQVAA